MIKWIHTTCKWILSKRKRVLMIQEEALKLRIPPRWIFWSWSTDRYIHLLWKLFNFQSIYDTYDIWLFEIDYTEKPLVCLPISSVVSITLLLSCANLSTRDTLVAFAVKRNRIESWLFLRRRKWWHLAVVLSWLPATEQVSRRGRAKFAEGERSKVRDREGELTSS